MGSIPPSRPRETDPPRRSSGSSSTLRLPRSILPTHVASVLQEQIPVGANVHRITECCGLEGVSVGHLVQPPSRTSLLIIGTTHPPTIPVTSSKGHRITERFGLEGTFRGHLAQPPAVSRDISSSIRLPRAPSNLAFDVSRDGASTTSLGNPFQCFTTLIVKNFFLISSLNLPSLGLKP